MGGWLAHWNWGLIGGRAGYGEGLWVVGQPALPPNGVGVLTGGQWPGGRTMGGWPAGPAPDLGAGLIWGWVG